MTPSQQKLIVRERRIKIVSALSLLILGITVVIAIPNMMASCLLAAVITYLFKPVVNYLERRGMERGSAILFLFLATGAMLGIGIAILSPLVTSQYNSLMSNREQYTEGLTNIAANIEHRINNSLKPFYEVNFSSGISSYIEKQFNYIVKMTKQLFTVLILGPFFAFFVLRDGRQWSRLLLRMVPNNLFEFSLHLLHQINIQVGDFIRARLLEALIVGSVVWIGIFAIGAPYAVFLAVFAGLTNLIPYIGPVIGAIPGIAIILLHIEPSFSQMLHLEPFHFSLEMMNREPSIALLGILGIYILAQLIDMLFIIPLVVAKIVNLHPITVVVVIIIGFELMDIIGMIISIPVASTLKLTFQAIYNHTVNFRV